jgi:chromosome segregation ATPase
MNEENFHKAINQSKIPVLVLDNKWHRLFAVHGKPDSVTGLENEIKDLLSHQGQLNNDLKSLKKIKNQLMENIVSNMDSEESEADTDKEMDKNKRLIEETNEKMEQIEDELLDIPREIDSKNRELMFLTMGYCYNHLRTNKKEAVEIDEWIKDIRVKLKKNIIRKQNRVINNKEMYAYMHDIFGKDVLDLFDVRYEDFEEGKS